MTQVLIVLSMVAGPIPGDVPTPAGAWIAESRVTLPSVLTRLAADADSESEDSWDTAAQQCLDARIRRIRAFRGLGVLSAIVAAVAVPGLIAAGLFHGIGPDTSGGASPGTVLVGSLLATGVSVGGAVGGIRRARSLENECAVAETHQD